MPDTHGLYISINVHVYLCYIIDKIDTQSSAPRRNQIIKQPPCGRFPSQASLLRLSELVGHKGYRWAAYEEDYIHEIM